MKDQLAANDEQIKTLTLTLKDQETQNSKRIKEVSEQCGLADQRAMSLEATVKSLEEKACNSQSENLTLKTENQHLATEIQKLKEENSWLRKKNGELSSLNQDLLDNMVQASSSATPSESEMTKKKKVMLIGDSNTHRSSGCLDKSKTEWTLANKIFTTVELKEALLKDQVKDELKKHDLVILSQGTNDLRRGKLDDQNIVKNLIQSAETIHRLTRKQVLINQVPPMTVRGELAVKTALLNRRIGDIKTKGVTPLLSGNYYKEHTNEEIIDKDGIHLTQKGSELFAKALAEAVHPQNDPESDNKTSSDPTPSNTTEKVINTTLKTASHVIGKSGANVKRLETEHKVTISSEKNQHGCKLRISGEMDNVKRASAEVNTIIERKKDTTVEKKTPVCRYYTKGGCNFGDECRYRHPRKQQPAKRRSSPEDGKRDHNLFSVLE